jgi:hypothetical protein
VFGVEDERSVHCANSGVVRRFAEQQMQKMRRHARAPRLGFDAFAVFGEVIPIQQHRRKRRKQAIGHMHGIALFVFRLKTTERRTAGA